MQYTVYILRCSDGSCYAGVTNDCAKRLQEHQSGSNAMAYTYSRRPVRLVYSADFADVTEAIAWEKKIKRWSRHKKEALIAGRYEDLPKLSLSATPTPKLLGKIKRAQPGLTA